MRNLLTRSLLALLITSPLLAADPVKLTPHEHHVDIEIAGEPFTTFHHAPTHTKPFFHPVYAPGGIIITRPLATGEDHPHHKGIWIAIDEVNHLKHWAEKHRIENQRTAVVTPSGVVGTLEIVNHWLDAESRPVLAETTRVDIYPNRTLAFTIQFTPAADQPVVFGDTKEGLFGIRVANSLREKEGGRVVNADNKHGTSQCWGIESPWVDYSGEVDGKTVGVTLFDHPNNFRKSRWHVRDYGLFTVNPFGQNAYTNGQLEAAPYSLEPKSTLTLRYGLNVHAGDHKAANPAETYTHFLNETKE